MLGPTSTHCTHVFDEQKNVSVSYESGASALAPIGFDRHMSHVNQESADR